VIVSGLNKGRLNCIRGRFGRNLLWGYGHELLGVFCFPNCPLMHEGGRIEMEPEMYKAVLF